MFAKLLTIVLAFGAIAAMLLVNRQERIDTVHDMAQAHERIADHDRHLWRMRREITELSRPQRVRELMRELDTQWVPIQTEPGDVPTHAGWIARHAVPEPIELPLNDPALDDPAVGEPADTPGG